MTRDDPANIMGYPASPKDSDLTAIRMAILCEEHSLVTSYAPMLDLAQFMLTSVQSQRRDTGISLPAAELVKIADQNSALPVNMDGIELVDLRTHLGRYDLIFLPTVAGPAASWPAIARMTKVCRWIKREHAEGAIVGAVRSGVIQVAASGVLDHGAASIHPDYGRHFARRFLHVRSEPVPICSSGRVYTARDVGSAPQLVAHLGGIIANQGLGLNFLRYTGMDGDTDAHSGSPLMRVVSDPIVSDAKAWMIARYRDDLRLETIAAAMGVGSRTFARRFKAAMGITPVEFLQAVRVDVSIAILRWSNMPIDEVAQAVGYRDTSFFRGVFRLRMGVSPSQYRLGSKPRPEPGLS